MGTPGIDVDTQVRVWMTDYAALQVLNNFVELYDGLEATTAAAVLDTLTSKFDILNNGKSTGYTDTDNMLEDTRRRLYIAKFAWCLQHAFSNKISEIHEPQRLQRTEVLENALDLFEQARQTMGDPYFFKEATLDIKIQLLLSALTYVKDISLFKTLYQQHFEEMGDDPEDNPIVAEMTRSTRKAMSFLKEAHSEDGKGVNAYTDEIRDWRLNHSPQNFMNRMREMVQTNFAGKSMLVLLAERTDQLSKSEQNFQDARFTKAELEEMKEKYFETFPEDLSPKRPVTQSSGSNFVTPLKKGRQGGRAAARVAARRVRSDCVSPSVTKGPDEIVEDEAEFDAGDDEGEGDAYNREEGGDDIHEDKDDGDDEATQPETDATSVKRPRGRPPKVKAKTPESKENRGSHQKTTSAMPSSKARTKQSSAKEMASILHQRSSNLRNQGADPLDEITGITKMGPSLSTQKTRKGVQSTPTRLAKQKLGILAEHESGQEEKFTTDDDVDDDFRTQPSPVAKKRKWIEHGVPSQTQKRKRNYWTEGEVHHLRKGVERHGRGRWDKILNDRKLEFNNRSSIDLKDKWRNLELKGEV